MPFLGEAWYVACFADEVTSEAAVARTICGEPMFLYRDHAGDLVAVRDACPHRMAPLSMGIYQDGVVTCRYHGLSFGSGGQCVANPHGAITSALSAKSWPVIERHGFVWVWPGDPAEADPVMLPDLSIVDATPVNGQFRGYLPTAANYQLCTDNILDLSHVDYLHPDTLGGGLSSVKPKVTADGDSVNIRWENLSEVAPAAFDREFLVQGAPSDTITQVTWYPPAIMRLRVSITPTTPEAGPPISITTAHIMTPETDMTTHYFFVSTRDFHDQDPAFNAGLAGFVTRIFTDEDKPMLEAQQARLGTADLWSANPAMLPIDSGAVQVRRVLDRLMA